MSATVVRQTSVTVTVGDRSVTVRSPRSSIAIVGRAVPTLQGPAGPAGPAGGGGSSLTLRQIDVLTQSDPIADVSSTAFMEPPTGIASPGFLPAVAGFMSSLTGQCSPGVMIDGMFPDAYGNPAGWVGASSAYSLSLAPSPPGQVRQVDRIEVDVTLTGLTPSGTSFFAVASDGAGLIPGTVTIPSPPSPTVWGVMPYAPAGVAVLLADATQMDPGNVTAGVGTESATIIFEFDPPLIDPTGLRLEIGAESTGSDTGVCEITDIRALGAIKSDGPAILGEVFGFDLATFVDQAASSSITIQGSDATSGVLPVGGTLTVVGRPSSAQSTGSGVELRVAQPGAHSFAQQTSWDPGIDDGFGQNVPALGSLTTWDLEYTFHLTGAAGITVPTPGSGIIEVQVGIADAGNLGGTWFHQLVSWIDLARPDTQWIPITGVHPGGLGAPTTYWTLALRATSLAATSTPCNVQFEGWAVEL